ncbi:MAG: iron-sulfur cluster carrier protein ApbC [Deltaproteobacteria bacterium]|nr:iron-sulfur cluster carrier protein ApbC [Deltaproteobacteria bacterium]MBI3390740.1 iron-sulfur cluster carrier protein ApbC [Deltaproteobacteria bacterium]
MATPTPQQILDELKKVKYPGYTRDIVSFGLIKDVEVASAGVTVTLTPTTENPDVLGQIRDAVVQAVTAMGFDMVEVAVTAPEQPVRRAAPGRAGIPGIKRIVAVASGKGGVGKSTVAVNLALALHALGQRVGLLDADVYGPSVPLMLGLTDRPTSTDDKRIIPIEKFGIKVISMGLFIEERTPVIWRGPMINKLLTQFLREVEWGELDVLVLDLPPGTGDAQLTIVQQAPLSGGVIVTTPQDVALLDVKRGITMFQQVNAPVLGVIENMSFHICPGCGDRADLFGHGGGAKMAEQFSIPLLGEIPLVREIREHCDTGEPIVVAEPEHPQSLAFRAIATRVLARLDDEKTVAPLPTIH